jgi:hypothetical protein
MSLVPLTCHVVLHSGVKFGGDGFVEVLAATQTPKDKEWFQARSCC